MSRTLWLVLAACGAVACFFVLSSGESEAVADEYAAIGDAMHAQVRALPGYEIEPATFDKYFQAVHPAACNSIFVEKGLDPTIPDAHILYVGEVYRLMIDLAFTEGRTDLTDVVTRGYMKVVQGH